MAILFNDVWHGTVIDSGCCSSRILWIKFMFSRFKVCVVVGYDPSKGYGEEKRHNLERHGQDSGYLGNGYILCILGDLNDRR